MADHDPMCVAWSYNPRYECYCARIENLRAEYADAPVGDAESVAAARAEVLDALQAKVEQWRAEAEAVMDSLRDRAWRGGPLEDRDDEAIEAYDRAAVVNWEYQRFLDLIKEMRG